MPIAGAPRTRSELDRLPDRRHVAAVDLDELRRQPGLVDQPQVTPSPRRPTQPTV